MKFIHLIIFFLFLINCSFDNKSGIWNNEKIKAEKKDENIFKDFKKISATFKVFDKVIPIDRNYEFFLNKPSTNDSWKDTFYADNNNKINFKLNEDNKVFKSKKLTKFEVSDDILFFKNNLILSDNKGNLITFSIESNSIISSFNFYNKKFKKIDKKLNLVLDNDIIYVSDNLGYLYAYNFLDSKIIWAKNYKIPFRSNMKIFSKNIAISNQNNDLYIINKSSGNLIKLIPTEETLINNSFKNNIALSEEEIFFINTYGSLYSINKNNYKLNWFLNLNQTVDMNLSNLFFGSPLVRYENKIFVSSNENFYIISANNGSIKFKKNFSSSFRPLVNNKYIFIITDNNYLLSLSHDNGKIIYSYNIDQKISDFTKTKKKTVKIKDFFLINNQIFIFLENSYLIKFNLNGEINKLAKLPSNLNSNPIIVDNSLLFLGKKNRLLVLN